MTLDTSNENQLVDKFFAEHKEIVEEIVERAVEKRVAEILEQQHEKVMERIESEADKRVLQIIIKDWDAIRIFATERVCEKWLANQAQIDGKIVGLDRRVGRLERPENDADWWKKGGEHDS